MKVLHLFSDWKWTGPAEPALEMVRALRRDNVDVLFAVCPLPFEAQDTIQNKALEFNVPLIEKFSLKKHFDLVSNLKDIFKLKELVTSEKLEIIHTHRHQDHLIGACVAKMTGVKLVRSSHDGVALKNDWRHRLAIKQTDLYLPVSQQAFDQDQYQFSISSSRIKLLLPAIDTERFSPERSYQDMRSQLGIGKDKIVVGIVARMQRHRRFQELLEAWAKVAQQRDQVHFIIIGRGTNMQEVAVEPSKKLGLSERLTFAGYHRETYIDMLNALDIKVFLVPGSDGSCRALRQALSLGMPVIGARRGMIEELIDDQKTGFIVDDTADNLARAILKLVDDDLLRKKMSQQARQVTLEKFSLIKQSKQLKKMYQYLIS